METIECSKCGAIFEKTGAKDKLRRFKDKRFMTTFHCPNCDARVILKNGDEPISIYLKRLERLKEQARRLGDRQEVNELQDEIDQINREIKMNAGKTKDKKFSMKGNDAYDPTKPKNIAKAKALSVAQGKAASDAKDDVNYLGEKVFRTYESWKMACKKVNPDVVFEGDRDICNAKPGIGEWDGVKGVIYKTDDEGYDPLDPENIAEEKELAKARGAAAADAKSAIITVGDNNWDIIIMDSTHIKMSLRYSDGKQNFGIPLHINQLSPDFINALKAKGLIKGNYFVEDSRAKDSLFKGQKVTAIKSEQGLREGETYTVLGEEAIIKQVVGEGNTIVYKLQDSSGNVIVIENPEGLFYEVKDSKTKDDKMDKYLDLCDRIWAKYMPVGKLKQKDIDLFKSKARLVGVPENMITEYLRTTGDSDSEEENESLKVKIGDIKKNMDAARKMGYDTEPYQKEIDKLEAKDSLSYVTTYKGYEIASSDKNIADKFLTTSKGTFLAANTLEELKKKIDKLETKDAVRPGTVEVGKTLFYHGREGDVVSVNGNKIVLDIDGEKYTINASECESGTTGDSKTKDEWTEEEIKKRMKRISEEIDKIVLSGGVVGLGDPLSIEYGRLKSKLKNKTKDDNSKNGYYAGMTGKARTDNPFPKGTPENQKWDSDWKIGNEDFKYESNKELFKPKDSKTKDVDMLVIQYAMEDIEDGKEPNAALAEALQDQNYYGEKSVNVRRDAVNYLRGKGINVDFNKVQRLLGITDADPEDDKELKEMLVNDAPDYYGAIVATARRGNNPQMGSKEVRKNLEPFMSSHGVAFNEQEFNKAYKEFNKAGVSKAAFMKGTDAKDEGAYKVVTVSGKVVAENLNQAEAMRKLREYEKENDELCHIEKQDSNDSSDIYTKDPLTKKGQKILAAMQKVYGEEKGKQVFYASKSKGTISGVDGKTKDEEVHLSGSINKDKSVIDRLLKFWEGQYSGQTDKGAIFKFKNESDANGFRKDIKKQVFSVFVDSKTKDQEIKIIIGEDPTSPSPAEQKVEGNDVIYKEYTLKQLPETGEFEIYAPGGSIVGHAKALELAKLFVDRIVASRVGDEWSEEARKKL